jgi:hypothetical protein
MRGDILKMKPKTILTLFLTLALFMFAACSNSTTQASIVDEPSAGYIKELEQGHHTGDLDPQNVLMTFIDEKEYDINNFELSIDGDMEKSYVYPEGNIEIKLSATDVKTSNGDFLRVWSAEQFLYYELGDSSSAASIAAPPVTTEEKSESASITFPVSDKGKTELNTAVYEITPFNLVVTLPTGWSLVERDLATEFDTDVALQGVWSVLDIYDVNNERIGAVGYNTYEPIEGAEDVPQAIYGQIGLGNDYHFDIRDSYAVVNESDSGVTATADVYYSASINKGTEKTNKGIVSYNKDLLAYIAIEFTGDMVTDEQVEKIANSIRLED